MADTLSAQCDVLRANQPERAQTLSHMLQAALTSSEGWQKASAAVDDAIQRDGKKRPRLLTTPSLRTEAAELVQTILELQGCGEDLKELVEKSNFTTRERQQQDSSSGSQCHRPRNREGRRAVHGGISRFDSNISRYGEQEHRREIVARASAAAERRGVRSGRV
jgi:hypothetical protein